MTKNVLDSKLVKVKWKLMTMIPDRTTWLYVKADKEYYDIEPVDSTELPLTEEEKAKKIFWGARKVTLDQQAMTCVYEKIQLVD